MDETRDPRHDLEAILVRVGSLTGAVAGTVGFLYVVGGAVMWVRFWRAGLPADQALALVPRSELLVIGMRVLILPALAAGLLFLLLARRKCAAAGPVKPAVLACLAATVLGLALVVPFAPGAYAWPLAALALWYVWLRVLAARDGKLPRALVWRAAVAGMLAAALVSIARQFDHPVKLPSATLTLIGADAPVTGVLVSAAPDAVVVGLPEEHRLTSYPRGRVETIAIGPALDRRAPQRSLLSMALGGNAWAATPLEVWCGGEAYSWTEVGDLCQTQPEVVAEGSYYDGGRLRVPVSCPELADDGCSGFLTVSTRDPFAIGDLARAAPVELGRTAYQIEGGETLPVSLRVGGELRHCLRTAQQPLALRAVLSSDRAARGALNDGADQRLEVDFDRHPAADASDCAEPEPLPATPPPAHEKVVIPAGDPSG